jgi:hypothetical protein
MAASRPLYDRLVRAAAIGAGSLVTLFGVTVAGQSLNSYLLIFPLLATGSGVLMLYFAIFRSDALSFASIIILVISILITPYVGLLIFAAISGGFTSGGLFSQVGDGESVGLFVSLLWGFWYWIPVSAMTVFPLTVPASLLGLVIVHFYIKKQTLPLRKSKWIIYVSVLGSILGMLAVLLLFVSMTGFPTVGGVAFHSRTWLSLLIGLLTGCVTGFMIALLTYRRILLFIRERESAGAE